MGVTALAFSVLGLAAGVAALWLVIARVSARFPMWLWLSSYLPWLLVEILAMVSLALPRLRKGTAVVALAFCAAHSLLFPAYLGFWLAGW
jgi:hypothetical protein